MRERIVDYRLMELSEISRLGEVNREEQIQGIYVVRGTASGFGLTVELRKKKPPVYLRAWSAEGLKARINTWGSHLEEGGWLYGAFLGERLVGFIILGRNLRDRSAEIIALFVDRDHRRLRIGQKLMHWAEDKARETGIISLFLYSNPTESSAGFYLKNRFKIVGLISKEIVKSLPGDIVMAKRITE